MSIAVIGVTGQVGSVVADTLLVQGKTLRAVVRDAAKGEAWHAKGAEVAIADLSDSRSLATAWEGVEGAFVVVPPNFAPEPGFPEIRALARELIGAIQAAQPPKIVVLSTVGAHRTEGIGILEQLHILESELGATSAPVSFVRAGWFMENAKWDLPDARERAEIASFLQPLDHPIPMVSTLDVGRVCAETLLQDAAPQIVELEGPRRYSPDDLARAFTDALGRDVRAVAVSRETWHDRFVAQGTPSDRTAGRIEMLDGFNSGWIDFEGAPIRGRITLDEAVAAMAQ